MKSITLRNISIFASIAFALLAFFFAAKAFGQPPACTGHKILICHHPPGNFENVQSICIDKSAWENPHEKHGDTEGSCPNPTIVCGAPIQVVPGTLEIDVVATGWPITGPFVLEKVGPVTMDEFTCAPAGDRKWGCSYRGSGDTEYEGDQSLLVVFDNGHGLTVECLMEGDVGGLPVELQEFQVN